MNTHGTIFRFTTFGESHGPAIGGVIDGMPAGVYIDMEELQRQLDRRRPGQSALTTARREEDKAQLLSGIFEGVTTGAPIGFIIPNGDHRSADYANLADALRPSHADYTYEAKYGIRDYRGGGRSSARETACRVVAGALAMQALKGSGISIKAYVSQVGDVSLPEGYALPADADIDASPTRCPDPETARLMEQKILAVKAEGDTVGAVVTCEITGAPAGLGEPIYGKLSAMLASAMFSINAVKGVEIGDGFAISAMKGSEAADLFESSDGKIVTATNHSGGIQGGITNGAPITLRVAFKPAPTLLQELPTVTKSGEPSVIHPRGRHDPCVGPRAVPVVEAMAACVMLDALLLNRCSRI